MGDVKTCAKASCSPVLLATGPGGDPGRDGRIGLLAVDEGTAYGSDQPARALTVSAAGYFYGGSGVFFRAR